MTKCKNCGHDSHCGVPKYGERLDFIDVLSFPISDFFKGAFP